MTKLTYEDKNEIIRLHTEEHMGYSAIAHMLRSKPKHTDNLELFIKLIFVVSDRNYNKTLPIVDPSIMKDYNRQKNAGSYKNKIYITVMKPI